MPVSCRASNSLAEKSGGGKRNGMKRLWFLVRSNRFHLFRFKKIQERVSLFMRIRTREKRITFAQNVELNHELADQ